LGNAADAEDAVQDALLAAYKHLDQFKGRSQMSTWLTAIVHNSARMQLRARLRHLHVSLDESIAKDSEHSVSDRLADDGPTPEDEYRRAELDKRLRHLTTQLSPVLLKTFQLRDIEGLSIRETAKILGIPNGTVKAQLARAHKRLKLLMRRTLRPRSPNLTGAYRQDVLV
jgi:RNA polymerase sigma-70 factor (ECF subfamily)